MKNIQQFDLWFKTLSGQDQKELLHHIIASHFEPTMEGMNVGPAGQRIAKGLFSGPVGYTIPAKCSYCGK